VDNFINKAIISKEECITDITVTTSGFEALEFLKSLLEEPTSFPDVIFLDIRMPGMNGFEFLDEYIKLPENLKNHCKIYILSSSLDPSDSNNGKKYNVVTGHLTKPLAHHRVNELLQND
jgi:CheY-like chemotaxis protein